MSWKNKDGSKTKASMLRWLLNHLRVGNKNGFIVNSVESNWQ